MLGILKCGQRDLGEFVEDSLDVKHLPHPNLNLKFDVSFVALEGRFQVDAVTVICQAYT